MIPLWSRDLAAFAHEPWFKQDRESQVDVVATQQNVFADGNPRDVGDAVRRTGSQLEQAKIRGASADIDDQDVSRRALCTSKPSHNGSAELCCPSQQ